MQENGDREKTIFFLKLDIDWVYEFDTSIWKVRLYLYILGTIQQVVNVGIAYGE